MATHRRNPYTQDCDEPAATTDIHVIQDPPYHSPYRAPVLAHTTMRQPPTKVSVLILTCTLMISIVILLDTTGAHWQTQDLSSYARALNIGEMASPHFLSLGQVTITTSSQRYDPKIPTVQARRLLTVREMKDRMVLPCNYIHDGYYISDSNEMVSQVYLSLAKHFEDDIIPVFVEVGGHDGITKSLSLKASRCLAMNTLLIEASPITYRTLEQARGKYDWTVHAALCSGDSVDLVQVDMNSGANHVAKGPQEAEKETTVKVNCTSVDAEIDKLRTLLPTELQDKLQLAMLVLDVEGFEATAIEGIQKYRPQKVFMETKHLSQPARKQIDTWATAHNLTSSKCNRQDTCFNFDPLIGEQPPAYLKSILYGARLKNPPHTYLTKKSSEAYMFYSE